MRCAPKCWTPVIFDLSDAITDRHFDRAIALVQDLLAQRNSEIVIFTTIARHIQRLYAAKLNEAAHGSVKKNCSPFWDRLRLTMRAASAWRPIGCQRIGCANLSCYAARPTLPLKSSAADKQKLIELALLEMAAGLEHA